MIRAQECETMAEVRAGVDTLDKQIVTLLGERFRFMDAAARIKPSRAAVRDDERKAQVLENVRRTALDVGGPPDLITSLYEMLVESSIAYEFGKFDEHRADGI